MAASTLVERPTPTFGPVHERLDRAARWLSALAACLMAIAAATGLVVGDLYRDSEDLRHMLRGHDAVILFVVLPLLAWTSRAQRRHVRARMVWLGCLTFATYNYAVYVLGTEFNDLFLMHVAILEASSVALVLGLVATSPACLPSPSRRDARVAAAFLLFLAGGLAAMWIFNAVRFAINGQTPSESELVLPVASIHLGYALDLLLIVPAYATAALLLWRRSVWGSVIGAAVLSGGLLQQLTYMAALVFQHRAGVPGSTAFDPGEPVVVISYAVALWLALRREADPVRRGRTRWRRDPQRT